MDIHKKEQESGNKNNEDMVNGNTFAKNKVDSENISKTTYNVKQHNIEFEENKKDKLVKLDKNFNGDNMNSLEVENSNNSTNEISNKKSVVKSKCNPETKSNNNKIINDMEIIEIDDDESAKESEKKSENNRKEGVKNKNDVNNLNEKKIVLAGKECINLECEKKCDEFLEAPQYAINFYKIQNRSSKVQYICNDCCDAAILKYEGLCGLLVSRKLFLEEIPDRQEVVEIIDSDEEQEENKADDKKTDSKGDFNKDVLTFIEKNLYKSVDSVLKRVGIDQQKNMVCNYLDEKLHSLEAETEKLIETAKELEKKLDETYTELYSKQKVTIKELPAIDLNTGLLFSNKNASFVPPDGKLVYPPIKENECYYGMKYRLISQWLPCYLSEVINTPDGKLYEVKFDLTRCPIYKRLNAKQIAFSEPPEVRLKTGVRVIAVFDSTTLGNGKQKVNIIKNDFYPGIIAESLNRFNRNRYLIFFDDGYARYVKHENVRLVCSVSQNVWEDVHPSSRDFIKSFLTEPSRPMLQVRRGQTIMTESNGKWWSAKVVDVDSNLIQMQFDDIHKSREWIYRGSTRLAPLYKEKYRTKIMESSTQAQNESQPAVTSNESTSLAQPSTSSPVPSTSSSATSMSSSTPSTSSAALTVSSEPSTSSSTSTTRAVARKSVTRNQIPRNTSSNEETQQTARRPTVTHLNNSTIYLEDDNKPKGKVVYYAAKNKISPNRYLPHKCSPKCLYTLKQNLKNYSPLAKPLLCGWERLFYRHKLKKIVTYRAPCGLQLRNMAELRLYLRNTNDFLNVEHFCFDPEVNCLNEYTILTYNIQNPDLSAGKESVPIKCINYYDFSMPVPCKYSTERIPTEGVDLNLDPEFLVGCDCTDDCFDKSKCSCWQLTLTGAKFRNPNVSVANVGYSYKRLPDPVVTGIYECNSRCKCSKNCLNRVVQHPLQLRLQVFKTSNRGWGIRCLNDIPKGCFVCIYAGYLLTEQNANEGGAHFGDEYFAELDYIEVVEKMKEGYESDILDDLDSDDEDEDDNEEQNQEDDSDEDFLLRTKIPHRSPSVHTRLQSKRESFRKKIESGNKNDINDKDIDIQFKRKIMNFDAVLSSENNVNSNKKFKSVRKYFGKNESCYIMDAKKIGNIGRYFNHSCSPNLFVQNVFVDTHDIRFPWVAFFALHNITAGTELTWNYNYEVGVVPGKVLYCECGSTNCRGRLL